MTEPASYKTTLNLPQTNFDMKANLLTREPAMLKQWQEADLYGQIRKRPHPKGKWILHDGPPYANGDIHMGHLINKVLKDIVVKFRTMQGHDSPYVPGWDCHGLPIESAIQKELGPKFRELSKEDLRNKCHDYAMKFVHLQAEGFKRLGVFADYEHPYLTLDPKYESGILEVLAELVQRDLVYRKKKPVHWCTNDRTALAEAELEYANQKDSSIYVMFDVEYPAEDWAAQQWDGIMGTPLKLMIWTTTPWTLPANRAVAVHPEAKYTSVRTAIGDRDGPTVILAEQLVEKVMAARGINRYKKVGSLTGAELASKIKYYHPLDPTRIQPVVLADYVTLEDGTGLVHTAPGHGTEDYQTGLRNNLEIYNPVLADGRYDDTVPEFLKGKTIWESNALVIEKLKELGTLFHHQEFDHSYPHCWRCKKPVIFRATEQWFVKASSGDAPVGTGVPPVVGPEGQHKGSSAREGRESDTPATGAPEGRHSDLWQTAKRFVDSVQFIPAWGKNRLDGMLDTRPDWCISRQRSWGVPIPAFFDDKGNCLLTEKSTRAVAAYFKEHGATSWYTDSPEKILGTTEWEDTWVSPSGTIENRKSKIENWSKGADILDVWFESGASHHAVLECTHPELGYPANLYLEGSDQHRGWFQSSLLEAAGYKSEPPFKQLLTHGFIVDEKGRKMSKSEGNDIKVEAALKEFGADILRLWVCSVDYQNDIPCSKELFKTIGEAYRKIRNTIRYLLGNLYDFDNSKDQVELDFSSPAGQLDKHMQRRADAVFSEAYAAYDKYEFHGVFKLLYEFCNVEISAFYAKGIKDRLYCELPNSPMRRRSQTVCYDMLIQMVKLLAPVMVYTSEEAWSVIRSLPGGNNLPPSVHLTEIVKPDMDRHRVDSLWEEMMRLVDSGNKQLEELKRSIGLGNPLDAEAVIITPKGREISGANDPYRCDLEDVLGCGFSRVEHGETWDIKINDTREIYPSCARSWKRRPDVGSDPQYPDLSARDAAVVKALK